MLIELLEDYSIVNSVGENMGKIKEVYFDLEKWVVSGFEISPGFFKKDTLLRIEDVLQIKMDEKLLVVRDEFKGADVPSTPTRKMYPFKELSSKPVIDNQGEKIGKIYNMEIPYEKLNNLKIWKVLIRTGIKERRLRLAPMEIREVMDEVKLRKAFEEYKIRLD